MNLDELLLCSVVGGLIGALFGAMSMTDDIGEQDRIYCEMTQIYINTGGEYGWPDYRGNRDTVCED